MIPFPYQKSFPAMSSPPAHSENDKFIILFFPKERNKNISFDPIFRNSNKNV